MGQFAQFLADGGGEYFDIAAFHGYGTSDTGEAVGATAQAFKRFAAIRFHRTSVGYRMGHGGCLPFLRNDHQEAFVSTGFILQAAMGVQTEIFYAYDNADSALYNSLPAN